MPRTGVYVIREADHTVLYLNQRARDVSPAAVVGETCPNRAAGGCAICLVPAMGDRREFYAVSYNPYFGGMVDISAARILWEDGAPAFVVTASPRSDTMSFSYRKILHVDLDLDRCDVLRAEAGQWTPEKDAPMSESFRKFAESGAVHPEDAGRFIAFTRLEHLRSAALSGKDALTLIYRRKAEGGYRWNLMEVFPWQESGQVAILCVKDIHDMLRESLDRVGLTVRSQELIRSLGEQNLYIYTIDLNTGFASLVQSGGVIREDMDVFPWDASEGSPVHDRLLEAYRGKFASRFSLDGLRQARAAGRQKTELLCQWREGDAYRYISVAAHFSEKPEAAGYTVLAIQDVDERMRRELAYSKRDMQMAAIVRSRYQMMNTVYLDTGLCERVDLRSEEAENVLVGDYTAYIERALAYHVHPEDVEAFLAVLSLDHLRARAGTVESSDEEICQYRLKGGEDRWIEQHVLYSRQKGQVIVNILGQDVTREKSREEDRLRVLEDRAYMITSLSSLFFSTYYIDLERDTFRAVTQLHRVKDVLGDEVHFATALRLYAEQFIHPDDRENYMQTMSAGNLRKNLRWWQPYLSTEYRKLPDFPGADGGSCQWVRCTALLARVGADDLPKTAVYVARAISEEDRENRRGI